MAQIYRVSFFKRLVDSTGHPCAPEQGAVVVDAASEDEAVELARLKFAKIKNVCSWSLRADYHEVAGPMSAGVAPEIGGVHIHPDSCTHRPNARVSKPVGIPRRTLPSEFVHT